MELALDADVAVVIGGAQGIGLAIARAFVKEGASVVLADVSPSTAAVAESVGADALGVCCDATDFEAIRSLVQRVLTTYGRCDHLVYAAGAGSGKYGFPFWNLEPGDWRRVVEINLIGAVNAAHAFAPVLVEAGRGSILFLSSIAGQIGSQTDPPYSAAKAGVINFMQCAAKDLAEFNVRVNAIAPGMVKTEVNRSVWQAWHDQQPAEFRKSYDEWAADKIHRITPLRRWQQPEDIAAAAVFLASARAGNITGQTINVDGGVVMR